MNEKFTSNAHLAVNMAFLEANILGDSYVGTEHLLLALAQTDTGCGALLCELGLSAANLRSRLKEQPRAYDNKRDCADMTPKLKKLLLKASKEAGGRVL